MVPVFWKDPKSLWKTFRPREKHVRVHKPSLSLAPHPSRPPHVPLMSPSRPPHVPLILASWELGSARPRGMHEARHPGLSP